jgi:hypothetical protein
MRGPDQNPASSRCQDEHKTTAQLPLLVQGTRTSTVLIRHGMDLVKITWSHPISMEKSAAHPTDGTKSAKHRH